MLLYCLNVRREQLDPDETRVRLPSNNLVPALKNYLQWVMLFAPSREDEPGYLGLVKIMGVHPDLRDQRFILVDLGPMVKFDIPVTFEAIYGKHHNQPFFRYAHAFRVVPVFELQRIFELAPAYAPPVEGFSADDQVQFTIGKLPRRASTSRLVRSAAVRFNMLSQYGTSCPFTGNDMMSLDGLRSAIEVGHVRPLRFYGKDHIQNVLPMSSLANWAWDEGLISIGKRAELLLARGLPNGTRALFSKFKEIRLPKDLRVWPLEENFEFHRGMIFERSLKEREQTLLELRRLHGDSAL